MGSKFVMASALLAAWNIYAAETKVEAETGTLEGVSVMAGGSGSFVGKFTADGNKVTLKANVATAGDYALVVGMVPTDGGKVANVSVNGITGSVDFQAAAKGTTTFDVDAGMFAFTAGENTIVVTTNWTYFGVDYVVVKTPEALPAPVKPGKVLSDPLATSEAKNLHSWLVDQYGSFTVSGQMETASADVVKEKAGVMPAILIGDYIDYSRNRDNRSETAVDKYLDSAKAGYLVSLMWHWNAPMDINDGNDADGSGNPAWWGGFYTRNTTFDLETAVTDKNSAEYLALIGDIDVVAASLKKFQDAKVPVLWRPLHEAAGGWFWWGAFSKTASAADKAAAGARYVKLWNILYERLVSHHGLHNLIWVWTSNGADPAWYPGDDKVDVVGMDIYTTSTDLCVAQWKTITGVYGGKKLIALSEFGGVPNIPKMQSLGVWWSYFAPWEGRYSPEYGPEGATVGLVDSVYNGAQVISRDDIQVTEILAGVGLPIVQFRPGAQSALGQGPATLFAANGRPVAVLNHASLIELALVRGALRLDGVAPGTYWLRRSGLVGARAVQVETLH